MSGVQMASREDGRARAARTPSLAPFHVAGGVCHAKREPTREEAPTSHHCLLCSGCTGWEQLWGEGLWCPWAVLEGNWCRRRC